MGSYRADAVSQAHVAAGAVGSADALAPPLRHLLIIDLRAVGQPDIVLVPANRPATQSVLCYAAQSELCFGLLTDSDLGFPSTCAFCTAAQSGSFSLQLLPVSCGAARIMLRVTLTITDWLGLPFHGCLCPVVQSGVCFGLM